VQVIADQMGVDAVLAEDLRHRVVERLERAPAPVDEVEPAGVQIAASRHAGQAPDVMGVEDDRALGEAIEAGRPHHAAVETESPGDRADPNRTKTTRIAPLRKRLTSSFVLPRMTAREQSNVLLKRVTARQHVRHRDLWRCASLTRKAAGGP
jgi:hypothetical protein